jgi:hypothetical protein
MHSHWENAWQFNQSPFMNNFLKIFPTSRSLSATQPNRSAGPASAVNACPMIWSALHVKKNTRKVLTGWLLFYNHGYLSCLGSKNGEKNQTLRIKAG